MPIHFFWGNPCQTQRSFIIWGKQKSVSKKILWLKRKKKDLAVVSCLWIVCFFNIWCRWSPVNSSSDRKPVQSIHTPRWRALGIRRLLSATPTHGASRGTESAPSLLTRSHARLLHLTATAQTPPCQMKRTEPRRNRGMTSLCLLI